MPPVLPDRLTAEAPTWRPSGAWLLANPKDAAISPNRGGETTTWLPAMLLHDTVRNQVTVTPPNPRFIPVDDRRSVYA